MRASAIVEKSGIPSASLICDGFGAQASATASGFGIANLPVVRLVGHVDAQSSDELRGNLDAVTIPQIIDALTKTPEAVDMLQSYGTDEVVARGTFDEINHIFEKLQWSDGLDVVPPTRERVAEFLAATSDDPDRVIGPLMPSGSAATVRNVAVNGVMAGCRPDCMPVLLAIAEILADPHYGVGHSGDTTGGEAQIIISGPVVKALGFNYGNGALRDGFRANTSAGRFLRLLLRNVARYTAGGSDKATFGHNWRIVLAEDDDAVRTLGWTGIGEDLGFAAGESVVTVGRFTGDTMVGAIYGNDPDIILQYLGDGLVRQNGWEFIFTAGFASGTNRPLVVLSPLVASTLARAGLSKADVRMKLFEYARLPASKLEMYLGPWTNLVPGQLTLADMVKMGSAPEIFAASSDPDRLVPVVTAPEHILVVVAGDPYRSNAIVHGSNGMHGFLTSRTVNSIAGRGVA